MIKVLKRSCGQSTGSEAKLPELGFPIYHPCGVEQGT